MNSKILYKLILPRSVLQRAKVIQMVTVFPCYLSGRDANVSKDANLRSCDPSTIADAVDLALAADFLPAVQKEAFFHFDHFIIYVPFLSILDNQNQPLKGPILSTTGSEEAATEDDAIETSRTQLGD
jgi:hypothetical protein